jgi:uncharacterized protein
MRIAIVGSGISGLTAAYLLHQQHEITVFEANDYIGGHTHTHKVSLAGREYAVDTGFIVCNPLNYPLFFKLLERCGVATQPTTMSFAARSDHEDLEYNATNINRLFMQRRNMVRPAFWRMVRDILRFYKHALPLKDAPDGGPPLGEYLAAEGYSREFRDWHLIPMGSALWSAPPRQMLNFPTGFMLKFFHNHRMLQVNDRPEWSVIKGGSSSYIAPLTRGFKDRIRLNAKVQLAQRTQSGVALRVDGEKLEFDKVIFACHSDQALRLLVDPTQVEQEVLGALPYQRNSVVLHVDQSFQPKRKLARAAWNALLHKDPEAPCTVTYNMNLLQGLDAPTDFLVTLNESEMIDPESVIKRLDYSHPIYTRAGMRAQQRFAEINSGANHSYFCGAYFGFGFHEDGVSAANRVVQALGGSGL